MNYYLRPHQKETLQMPLQFRQVSRTVQTRFAVFIGLTAMIAADVHAGEMKLLWGDTHLHSSLSSDAYQFRNRSITPDLAYRYAKGFPVVHPYTKSRIRISRPLDFLAVTDHAEWLGEVPSVILKDPKAARELIEMVLEEDGTDQVEDRITELMLPTWSHLPSPMYTDAFNFDAWEEIIDAAEDHYSPGEFTTLIGWEWTASPGLTQHRVVLTSAGGDKARAITPLSALECRGEGICTYGSPEDLWNWLEETSKKEDMDFVAIPHNPNLSRGTAFPLGASDGSAIDAAYAQRRMRWEPVIEVTQVKGDSEADPVLSATDEFAAFEKFGATASQYSTREREVAAGSFARSGLRRGLEFQKTIGANPYKFGLSGATDSHTGLTGSGEDDFQGKFGTDSIPALKDTPLWPGIADWRGWQYSASGLTAVWTRGNSREEIVAALKRKEVYATTGTRIRLQFFAGWSFVPEHAEQTSLFDVGYDLGVPMGGDLLAAPVRNGQALRPTLLIRAVKDPLGANLDRVQVVKGWVDSHGDSHERVYDVAWSHGRSVDRKGSPEPVGNTVDLATGRYANTIGAPNLSVVWTDPEFNHSQPAFYYVRVLEIPTPRHSLHDAIALRIDPAETKRPATIQERAYSSPIWYTP